MNSKFILFERISYQKQRVVDKKAVFERNTECRLNGNFSDGHSEQHLIKATWLSIIWGDSSSSRNFVSWGATKVCERELMSLIYILNVRQAGNVLRSRTGFQAKHQKQPLSNPIYSTFSRPNKQISCWWIFRFALDRTDNSSIRRSWYTESATTVSHLSRSV